MNVDMKPVRAKEQVAFRCDCCGACCRDLEGKLMLEPLDAYYLGRHMLQQGQEVRDIEDVYARYAHPIMLDGLLPIFVLNTKGDDHACTFLENGRCRVYEARPRVCRLYPFTVKGGQRGRRFEFYQCMDCHADHFKGGKVEVGKWMYQNFMREAKEFVEAEETTLPELGRLLKRLTEVGREKSLFHLLYYRYYNYDLAELLLPQYQRNHQALLEELRQRAERDG